MFPMTERNKPLRVITPNLPQLRSQMICAPVTVDVWSRGTGKSFGHAFRLSDIAFQMPRSKNIIEGQSYQQVLTKTLPGVVDALEVLGYFENHHFVLNQKPPSTWIRPRGLTDFTNTMSWINGSVFQIISQDRAGNARGTNVCSVTADELLTLDRHKLETGSYAANRGKKKLYDSPYYNSIHLSTSKGYGSDFRWVSDMGKYYEEELDIYQHDKLDRIAQLELQMIDSDDYEEQQQLWKIIRKLKSKLIWRESGKGVYYNEADIFDNTAIDVWKYVRLMRKVMSDASFMVEILNKSFTSVENGFYHLTDDHFYEATNYSYIESLDYDINKLKTETNDCRKDADLKADLPIDIGMDYGSYINCLVASQTYDNTDWYLSDFYVKTPELTSKAVHNFCDYYRFHKRKEVNYFYTHTALPGQGTTKAKYYTEVIDTLTSRGWKVNQYYLGQAPGHHERHLLFSIVLKGGDERFNRQMFNKTNCKNLIFSMQQAPLKQGQDGFKKDKTSEQRLLKTGNRQEATDFSEAWDDLAWGKNHHKMQGHYYFEPITFLNK